MRSIQSTAYLEVVDDTFAVEEVVGDHKEVPIQGLAPWVPPPAFIGVIPLQREQ